ncbi:MAG: primosomal protein N' [Burkholderiales bacterium]
MRIARVALDIPVHTLFDYRVSTHSVSIGQLVVVPFGKRRLVGIVFGLSDASELGVGQLRDIQSRLPLDPLPSEILSLIRFASEYYRCPVGQAAFTALPASFRNARYVGPKVEWIYSLPAGGQRALLESIPGRAFVMRRLVDVLTSAKQLTMREAHEVSPRAPAILAGWAKSGRIERRRSNVAAMSDTNLQAVPSPVLTPDQSQAVGAADKTFGDFACWLIEGVTGSGKTEVYFQLIARTLERRRQVLLMVPEINLTPQLEARFRARFDPRILVTLHSNLSATERARRWIAAATGDARVVLGTRLSIFTPMPDLGMIIVDEEHDASFKQQEGLRYSARDLALVRAKQLGIPAILGSATPSLETFHNVLNNKFRHLRLTSRPAAQMPHVRLVDDRSAGAMGGLTPLAIQEIKVRLGRGEQSLIFLNRRGYAPVLVCPACAWTAGCSRCSARLVWHLRKPVLRCHYCGHEEPLPSACPTCGEQDLQGLGQGTQRLEQTLAQYFPDARILRIDRDSTRSHQAWDGMRKKIHDNEIDILVGTQMLAKGHDFSQMTLVVIVNPDAALFSADFRASEKLLQQLMQVAGRAGRADLPGEVLVQTRFPTHPLYLALAAQDYPSFVTEMLEQRREAGFPPFVSQVLLRAEAVKPEAVAEFLARAAREGAAVSQGVVLYDPVPATMARIAGRHRAHLLVQSKSRSALQRFLDAWLPRLERLKLRQVRWVLDVDPLDF